MRRLLVILSCIPLLTGCAHIAVAEAKKEMQERFDNLMGCSEEEIVIRLGSPKNIQKVEDLKIYQYRKSYGTRTNVYANAHGMDAYSILTSGNANTWESYDEAEIVFKNGRAISWKGYVQR